jgi:predicted DCC family thiol-disulfide oxidoreductase YuxK
MLTWLTDQIGPRPLGLARIMIGTAAAIRAIVAWPVLHKLAQPETLKVPHFDWMPAPSVGLAVAVVLVWFISACLFAVGWRTSLAGPLLLFTVVFTIALDSQTYSNHLYLMVLLVLYLTLADAGAGLSIRGRERPVIRWLVLLPMMQLSVVYGFAGLTKLNEEFLSGRVLAGVLNGGLVDFPVSLRTPGFLMPLATAAVFVELFLAVFFWSARFRPTAMILGLSLHVSIVLFMGHPGELLVFALEMFALYPLFLSPGPLVVYWDDECGSCRDWIGRFRRFDLLHSLAPVGKSEAGSPVAPGEIESSIHVLHGSGMTRGFRAITRVLEHLVPWLWVAPILRLPGVRHIGERWYRWQAARRSCPAGRRP